MKIASKQKTPCVYNTHAMTSHTKSSDKPRIAIAPIDTEHEVYVSFLKNRLTRAGIRPITKTSLISKSNTLLRDSSTSSFDEMQSEFARKMYNVHKRKRGDDTTDLAHQVRAQSKYSSTDHDDSQNISPLPLASVTGVLTWFENRCKNNMSVSEWDELKRNMKEYLV